MILLTSDGLSSDLLISKVSKLVEERKFLKCILVVTADNVYKEKNYHVERIIKELIRCGLQVDLFDFDTASNYDILNNSDVIFLNGGNPYYLLDRIQSNLDSEFFSNYNMQEKLIIGMSAGSLVLQQNINIVDLLTPEINFVDVNSDKAIGIVDCEIIPHYDNFETKFDDLELRLSNYEKDSKIKVIKLNNGEGILIDKNSSILIKDTNSEEH